MEIDDFVASRQQYLITSISLLKELHKTVEAASGGILKHALSILFFLFLFNDMYFSALDMHLAVKLNHAAC